MSKTLNSVILGFILILACAILADASGEIVFLEYNAQAQGYYICTMNPDGTGVRRLTKKPGSYDSPRWSPDGTKIAYVNTSQLWIMNADGTSPELIHGGVMFGGLSWSPDGKRIVFTANGEITIMDLQTRETFPLILGEAPIWSTDGRAIAYADPFILFGDTLLLIDPETGRKWTIDAMEEGVNILHLFFAPISWSPDGKWIAFMGMDRNKKNWWGLYIMDSQGENVEDKHTGDGGDLVATWPTWSPHGEQIMFYTSRGIEVMDVDSNDPPELVYAGGSEPDWARAPAAVDSIGKMTTTWGHVKSE